MGLATAGTIYLDFWPVGMAESEANCCWYVDPGGGAGLLGEIGTLTFGHADLGSRKLEVWVWLELGQKAWLGN